jgi:predicted DNA binding CopG/RHH family protein
MRKKIPRFKTDEEAEKFLEQDLTDYIDRRNFKKVTFEFLPKSEKITLRLPPQLLSSVRKKAEREGISYQKYIRRVVEESLSLQ